VYLFVPNLIGKSHASYNFGRSSDNQLSSTPVLLNYPLCRLRSSNLGGVCALLYAISSLLLHAIIRCFSPPRCCRWICSPKVGPVKSVWCRLGYDCGQASSFSRSLWAIAYHPLDAQQAVYYATLPLHIQSTRCSSRDLSAWTSRATTCIWLGENSIY
jgi:hypothetical protein